ncbi:TetR/AcrR family transcriptional regulator [Kineococcus rhizosphaerae]|uniref:TetR family transcriptional regulator n=1 Tax=Kineococcus rhizosphaerae TaxID=559628 RepID=A0A2T0QWL9_9ACTN|nr:TetR/AcrR family transcriptional regulator [Kineococcus rhizosphaerae]PRY09773.1 TetR family transcriptional regulator [Kineococcus rhizosphaerae]
MAATRSTAEAQRALAVASATRVFARAGYHATPVAAVAADAGISPAYVFRLFDGKLGLFTAAVDHCFADVVAALRAGAERAADRSPEAVLDAMGLAYAELIADEDLLRFQVHTQSATDVPEIREALRRGLASVVDVVTELSGATPEAVQRFVAWGQLCHLVVTAGLDDVPNSWARTLSAGLRHF